MTHIGFPHSDIHGSKLSSSSPWLFAGKHVLHRLLVPRHPPYALSNLTFLVPRSAPKEHSAVGCACPSRSRVLSFGSPPDKGWSTLVVGLFSLDSEILSVMFAPQTSPPGRSRLCTPRATDVAVLGCVPLERPMWPISVVPRLAAWTMAFSISQSVVFRMLSASCSSLWLSDGEHHLKTAEQWEPCGLASKGARRCLWA